VTEYVLLSLSRWGGPGGGRKGLTVHILETSTQIASTEIFRRRLELLLNGIPVEGFGHITLGLIVELHENRSVIGLAILSPHVAGFCSKESLQP
jgi:hypothetical protein